LTTTYKRVEDSDSPEKVYKELQQLEYELRRRLHNLNASKGVPTKMTQFLNELEAALDHAVSEGVDAGFLIQGMADLLEDKPETQPAPKPERVLMMPDTKYKKVKAELAVARKKIQQLTLWFCTSRGWRRSAYNMDCEFDTSRETDRPR
jgi:hypothetical protein